MLTIQTTAERPLLDQVRLVYHYRDGHDFVTETMLRTEAVAYMPVLQASYVDPDHYEAAFASIELRGEPARTSELRLDGPGYLWAVPTVPTVPTVPGSPDDDARGAEPGRVVPVGPTEPTVLTRGVPSGARRIGDRAERPWVA
jgi:hypothetical protein